MGKLSRASAAGVRQTPTHRGPALARWSSVLLHHPTGLLQQRQRNWQEPALLEKFLTTTEGGR